MPTKIRAAIVRIAGNDALSLFSSELLWRPLGALLVDALHGAGVQKLLITSDGEVPQGMLSTIGTTVMCHIGDREAYREFIKGVDAAIYFNIPALIDAAAIGELYSCAAHLGPTIFISGGRHVAYGLSGEDLASPVDMLSRIALGASEGFRVLESHEGFCLPIANFLDLSTAENLYRNQVNSRLMENGVRIIGAETCFIAADAQIEPGVTILPGTVIRTGCSVGSGTQLGPYVYIRENCHIGRKCRIGDFVELKNANIGDGSKVSHLTYVGDADVGERVNFGCGTVTSNYDGVHKYRTIIEDDVFLGCNTNLVAPVKVGKRAYTAAGSTITDDVPEGDLAIARERQINETGYADRLMAIKGKKR